MESLLPLATFSFVASITPGPNNLMLAASGVGFGLERTVPHMIGVWVGFLLLVLVCGAGVGGVIMQHPAAELALEIGGSAYLVYLAWRLRGNLSPGFGIANRSSLLHPGNGDNVRPMTFAAAVAFQFANPKGWLMGITAASAFLPRLGGDWPALGLLCLVVGTVNAPCIASWVMLGATIRSRLDDARWQRRFSAVMVLLTLYAAAAVWL